MRIAHVTATFPPYYAGTGMVCYYNALELARRGHQVTVFTAAHPSGEYDYPEEITVKRLPILFRFGNAPFLPDLLKIRDFDIIHLHYPFIFGAEMVWLVSRLRKIPYVITHHNDLIGDGFRRYIFDAYSGILGRLIFRRASKYAVVTLSHAANCRMTPVFKNRWTDVIEVPNGVDTSLFHPDLDGREVRHRFGIRNTDPVILFVGPLDRAHHYRRVDLLIVAVRDTNIPKCHLLIVGDGDKLNEYRRIAAESRIGDHIHFLGKVAHSDLPQVYSAADVCVLPSELQESFGIVLIEAMACGKPVIASDLPGVRTVVSDHQDGLLVKPGNTTDLAANLTRLLEWPAGNRRAMGLSGRDKVIERYAWEQIAERLEGIYLDVLEVQTPLPERKQASLSDTVPD